MRRSLMLIAAGFLWVCVMLPPAVLAEPIFSVSSHPVNKMLGERLSYDISFLWFDRLAEGIISLSPGAEPGQYIALLEARTLGIAAFLTRNRVERFKTVMEISPDGSLRPLMTSKHSIKGEGHSKKERIRISHFNYADRAVFHEKGRAGKKTREKIYPMGQKDPLYDILSAFYNLRAGIFGPVVRGGQLALPTFTLRGTEDIIVTRVAEEQQERRSFFTQDAILCEVLVDPDTFRTRGRELYVGFDEQMVPQRAVVENVIGFGDVRGILRKIENVLGQKGSE